MPGVRTLVDRGGVEKVDDCTGDLFKSKRAGETGEVMRDTTVKCRSRSRDQIWSLVEIVTDHVSGDPLAARGYIGQIGRVKRACARRARPQADRGMSSNLSLEAGRAARVHQNFRRQDPGNVAAFLDDLDVASAALVFDPRLDFLRRM